MRSLFLGVLIAFSVSACQLSEPSNVVTSSRDDRALTFIVINDTYRLDNFSYVRSLRRDLAEKEGEVVVLHAGDFLYPSLLSQRYDGAQMIDIFNRLDGRVDAYDPHFLVTFGNHEFEKARMKHAPLLRQRIVDSEFTWLATNIEFSPAANMNGLPGLASSRLINVNGVSVGFVSATTDIKSAEYIQRFLQPEPVLREEIRRLRQQGARYVVAVTHQTVAEDKALIAALGADAPDLVAGGHEHDRQYARLGNSVLVKADADATSAAVVRVHWRDQTPTTDVQYVALPGQQQADPDVAAATEAWRRRFEQAHCQAQGAAEDCMRSAIGRTQVELVAEELTIRRFETNLGNFVADTALSAFAPHGAQIAFLNAGSLRLNYNIPAGQITRTHIDTLFAFPMQLSMIRITGAQLQQVINHAITDWTGNGRWLQISGFAFEHDPLRGTATRLSLITPKGLRAVKPDEVIYAVTNDYLLNRAGDQDGYSMIGSEMIINTPETPVDLKARVVQRIQDAEPVGISPQRDGRICQREQTGPCLVR